MPKCGVGGQMGRKPLPMELKVIRGTFRKNRGHPAEPTVPAAPKARPPAWMKDPVARKAWKTFRKAFAEVGILGELDATAVDLLATTYGHWRQAAEGLKVGVITTATGYPVPDPMVAMERGYAKQLQSLLSDFGMTPSSRGRINLKLPSTKTQDQLDYEGMEKMWNEQG